MNRVALVCFASVAITVASSAQTPLIGNQQGQVLTVGQVVERQLAAGVSHVYSAPATAGQRYRATIKARGAHIRSRAYAPDSTWLGEAVLFSDTAIGSIVLLAERTGAHRIALQWIGGDSAGGRYSIHLEQIPAVEAADARRGLEAATRWLKANAYPLRSVTAGSGFSDLAPLKRILSGVRVVGLGEATHGTREFFQVKHRIVEFLVREMGFTVFALETSQDAAHAINEFVLTGKGVRAQALARQGFFNWDTEEMGATLDWLRDYNRTVPASRKVRFAGFDFQYNPGARTALRRYLSRVAPERVPPTDSMLVILTESADSTRPDFVRYYSLSSAAKAPLAARVNNLLGFLVQNRARLVSRTSRAEYDSTLQTVRLLAQFVDTQSRSGYDARVAESGVAARDRYMAWNIADLMSASPPGTKIAVSSHNEHIRRDPYNMGYYLGERFGSAYYAFGLAFGQGGFQALSIDGRNPAPLTVFTVGPGFQETADWFLARGAGGDYFVDFRRRPKDGPTADWFTRSRALRSIGNGYAPMNPSGYYRPPVKLGKSYDGIVFVARTTRARPNPTVRR